MQRSDEYARIIQSSTLANELTLTKNRSDCDTVASDRPDAVDFTLRSLASTVFNDVRLVLATDGVYSMGKEIDLLKDFHTDGTVVPTAFRAWRHVLLLPLRPRTHSHPIH